MTAPEKILVVIGCVALVGVLELVAVDLAYHWFRWRGRRRDEQRAAELVRRSRVGL